MIGAFEYAAEYMFTSSSIFNNDPRSRLANNRTICVLGALANQMLGEGTGSSTRYVDPTDYMINEIRKIAFRASVQAAKDDAIASNATQTVKYTGTKFETIYKTNFWLIATAVLLNLLAVSAILPTYRGFWKLGRSVSLSPLEIARAFNAPLLRESASNTTWEQISDRLGTRQIKYGYVDQESGKNGGDERVELMFTDLEKVSEPVSNGRRRFQ